MTHWFSKEIGDGMQAFPQLKSMQEIFLNAFMLSGAPLGKAMFSRYDLHKNVVTVYFSPAAKVMAGWFGAKPCEKPSITGLALEAGDIRCWQELFPREEPKLR